MSRVYRSGASGMVLAAILAAVLLQPASALAGGWLVVTLDNLPDTLNADEAATFRFVIRQHGIHPIDGVAATATFVQRETGRQIHATAEPEGPMGRYVVRVTPLAAGTWDWSIDAWNARHPLPSLTVVGVAPASPSMFAPVRWPLLAVGTTLALIGLLVLVVAWCQPLIARRLFVIGHGRLAPPERQHF